MDATIALNCRIVDGTSHSTRAPLLLPTLQLLHALSEPFDHLAELVSDLSVLSRQFAMFVPTSLPILPVWQVKLLESVQSISCTLDFISNLSDALIDGISLNRVLLTAHRPLVHLVGEVYDLRVELSHAGGNVLKLLSDLLSELLVVDLLVV